MNQADQEYIQELAQNILEHSGVKGMKWGHRRVRNAIALGRAHANNVGLRAGVVGGKWRGASEKVASKISGKNKYNVIRRAAGTYIHNESVSGTYSGSTAMAQYKRVANKAVNKAIARNAKQTTKLQNKVAKKSGASKEKAKKQLEAWNAYSKSFNAKAQKTKSVTDSKFNQTRALVEKNREIHDTSNNFKAPKLLRNATRKVGDASVNGATKKYLGAYTGAYRGVKSLGKK